MLNKNKKFFNDIKLVIAKAQTFPSLPSRLKTIYSHPITRILRVIGGLITLLVILQKYTFFPYPFDIICLYIAIFHLFQIIFISITKVVYGIYIYIV